MDSSIIVRVMADYSIIPIVLIGTYMLLFKVASGHRFEVYSRVLMAGLTAYLLAKLAAVVYQPMGARPFELLGVSAGAAFLNNPGFPSDHALFATALTCAVWFETRNKVVSIVLASLVVLLGIGRVLALVHTPTDIIGGIVIGMIGALWYLDVAKLGKKSKPTLPS